MKQHSASNEEIVRLRIREFIQEVLEQELEEALGRSHYTRGGDGYRNGHSRLTAPTSRPTADDET